MKYIIFTLLLMASLNSFGQANSCYVVFDYKNESIEVALNTWKAWCKSDFVYDAKDLVKLRISGDHGLISLKRALNIPLEGSGLGWYQIDDKTIKIKSINKISRYVSISNKFQGTSLEKVFQIWKFNHKLDINYNTEDIAGIEIYGNIKDATPMRLFRKSYTIRLWISRYLTTEE